MSACIFTVSHVGLKSLRIEVEADISNHIPSFVLVGLPDTAVQEARERIRSALENSGFQFPRTKVTVNLAPAHIRKGGSFYDLAIAVSILAAQQSIVLSKNDQRAVFVGELSLDGRVRPVSGVLLAASSVKEWGMQRIYVAKENSREAAQISGIEVYGIACIRELADHLSGALRITQTVSTSVLHHTMPCAVDFSDIHGQLQAKRACEIAAAGGHNVLLEGTPGAGKTMLAKALPGILPPMNEGEALEVSKIYSYAGLLNQEEPLMVSRPFRSPHHTASAVSVIGGGAWPRPGEITLAHRGVLFFDELPEFPRNVLEALRQPLEDNVVWVSRAAAAVQFPANFIFIASCNPCPCGYWGDRERVCVCGEHQRVNYRKKMSGPLLDRIDLHVRVSAVKRELLLSTSAHESSRAVRERVACARLIQRDRFGADAFLLNSGMKNSAVKKYCSVSPDLQRLMIDAAETFKLSARAMYKVLKVSRTIADLAGRGSLVKEDILEALQYRQREAL